MSVADGQPVSAAYTNPAFLKPDVTDYTTSLLGSQLTLAGTGYWVQDFKRYLNQLGAAVGLDVSANYTAENDTTGNTYGSTSNAVPNGTTFKVGIKNLSNKFAQTTGTGGHAHTGTDGDAPQISISGGTTGILTMDRGGTNAALSPAIGAIPYSTATELALLAAGSSGQILRSGGAGAPSWSTATFPSTATGTGTFLRADGTNWVASTLTLPNTTTANQILYSSSANVVGQITTAATSALVTSSSSVPSFASGTTANRVLRSDGTTITFAQVVLSTDVTGNLPFANLATLTSGNILVGNGSNVAASVAMSGDVTISNAGVTAIGTNKVANSQLAQVATATFKGRTTAGTGNVEDLTATQATAMLNAFSSSLQGLAPASGGGTSNYLRADGTWAAPAGTGGFANPMTNVGDTIIGSTAGAAARLALGVNGQRFLSGATTIAWGWGNTLVAKSADYTILDTDGYGVIAMTTSSTDRTVTLPTAANNTDREITVKKVDSGTGTCLISGTIDGVASKLLISQNEFIRVKSNGTNWYMIDFGVNTILTQSRVRSSATAVSTGSTNNLTSSSITLKAGTWKLQGALGVNASGSQSVSFLSAAITQTSNTLSGADTIAVPSSIGELRMEISGISAAVGNDFELPLNSGTVVIGAGSTQTLYVVGAVDYTGGGATIDVFGYITAVRIAP